MIAVIAVEKATIDVIGSAGRMSAAVMTMIASRIEAVGDRPLIWPESGSDVSVSDSMIQSYSKVACSLRRPQVSAVVQSFLTASRQRGHGY